MVMCNRIVGTKVWDAHKYVRLHTYPKRILSTPGLGIARNDT